MRGPGLLLRALALLASAAGPALAQPEAAAGATPTPAAPDDPLDRVGFSRLRRAATGPGVTLTLIERLLDCVAEARGIGCILNIPFVEHATEPARMDLKEVHAALVSTRFRKLTDNPRILFLVVGYGSRIAGDESPEVGSLHRAEFILRELREKAELGNAIYAFGLGQAPSLTGHRRASENYVEVWAIVL